MSFVKSILNFLRFNKKNWKAVVLCMFAAMVFWFFNALNKNYSTNLNFPVSFEYDQERYIPIKSLPSTIRMNVTGSGWDLFRRSTGFKVPQLIIPLESPSEKRKIVGTTLPAVFASQLERLQINFVITDTVRIEIQEKIKKKFRVQLESIDQHIHADYGRISPLRIEPDTIWLEGPVNMLNALPEALSLTIKETDIKGNFNKEIALEYDRKLIVSDPQAVRVSFQVERFAETEKRVTLDIINAPSRLRETKMIHDVNCRFRLPESQLGTFSGDSLYAVIDLKNKVKGHYKIVPELINLPANVSLIKADSVMVNF